MNDINDKQYIDSVENGEWNEIEHSAELKQSLIVAAANTLLESKQSGSSNVPLNENLL